MSDLDNEEIEATREMKALNRIIVPEEKTADEMFEELGYSKIQNAPLAYQKATIRIEFCNYNKTFIKWDFGSARITVNELQAINQKCKELGWIE